MNKQNNKRRKESVLKIKMAFIDELQKHKLNEITISTLSKKANINRTTFYANFTSINELADFLKKEMFENLVELYKNDESKKNHYYNFYKLINHIFNNQDYYKAIFKLDFNLTDYFDVDFINREAIKHFGSIENIEYHIEFFKAGINSVIKKWLSNGCILSPEQINKIIESEYQGRIKTN